MAAPASANTEALSSFVSDISGKPTHSCIRCSDRKVKCDRQTPCRACVKHRVDCVYKHSQPTRKRHRAAKDQILAERLRQYETLLQAQGVDLSKLPSPVPSQSTVPGDNAHHLPRPNQPAVSLVPQQDKLHTPSLIEPGPRESISKSQLIHGQGRFQFVDNSLWTRVAEEFQDTGQELDHSSDDTSDGDVPAEDFQFVLNSQNRSRRKPYHPSSDHILQLWHVFSENIDPLTKVVHVPTLLPAMQKAASDTLAIPRGFDALLFAIYSTAVMSLDNNECVENFQQTRNTLLSRYISATKRALSRANFMGSTSLVVLQALVLHLMSIRDVYNPRAVWSLTGVAIRLAQGMGLERDGSVLGLSPYETEIRRRIWWILKLHDYRTAELCGLPKFRDLDMGTDQTKVPTNLNDDQLSPSMTSAEAESKGLTDMIFIALSSELATFASGRITKLRGQGKAPSQWNLSDTESDKAEMDEAVHKLKETLETKYLRYCDPSRPLHLLSMLKARLAMNIINFLTHHPRRWASIQGTPLLERQHVWDVSIKLLEQQYMALNNPQLKQFRWHAAYFQQWHAFIHVLDTLRAEPLHADAEKAWRLIGNIYGCTPDLILETKKPIHVAVGNLSLKAYADREAALRGANLTVPPTPGFVLQLRQQRDATRTKKKARDAKSSGAKSNDDAVHIQTEMSIVNLEAAVTPSVDNLTSAMSQPNISQHVPEVATEVDSFWFINGFGDNQFGTMDESMNMNPELMMDQDFHIGRMSTESIPWEQWDLWLADSNLIRGPL